MDIWGRASFRMPEHRDHSKEESLAWIKTGFALALLVLLLDAGQAAADRNLGISLTPAALNFGNQQISTTAQKAITLVNSGNHIAIVQNVNVNGSNAFAVIGWT